MERNIYNTQRNGDTLRDFHSRRKQLEQYLQAGIVILEDDDCYHLPKDSLDEIKASVCGLWFKGYKNCPHTVACAFKRRNEINVDTMGEIKCHHSIQRISTNFLTPKRVYKILENVTYSSKW